MDLLDVLFFFKFLTKNVITHIVQSNIYLLK